MLQARVTEEDKLNHQKISDLVKEWASTKPIDGKINPEVAIKSLNGTESKMNDLREDYLTLCEAKEALEISFSPNDQLEGYLEELKDLRQVWSALNDVWKALDEMKQIAWITVTPRKIRQQLESLIERTNSLPSYMRSYAPYGSLLEALNSFLEVHSVIVELRSDAIKERHWRQLLKVLPLKEKVNLNELVLGHIWDLDLAKHSQNIKTIVATAQGEMAVEECFKNYEDTWSQFPVELVNYQNKCRLIRGFDTILEKCSEHIASLTAMKHSPYYKVFEDKAVSWEEKLARIHEIFDGWIDVQKHWVYLESVFNDNDDLQSILPVESSRFQNVSNEFLTLMRKVYKAPFILEIITIPNLQKSLEFLSDSFKKIQKALGEYLEKQRSAFPRFYFVGDEDLLEILGNSKNLNHIQKHLGKMFAGISSVGVLEDQKSIISIHDRSNESFSLATPVNIENRKIIDWLQELESESKRTLVSLLEKAHIEFSKLFESSKPDLSSLIKQYPSQVCILASQIYWTAKTEKLLSGGAANDNLTAHLARIGQVLTSLAQAANEEKDTTLRRKFEQMIIEMVHEKDVLRNLIDRFISSPNDFEWLSQMRFYIQSTATSYENKVSIKIADAEYHYGFEYLGIPDRLVQTPLTNRCYLTLTQALKNLLGGSPFGPAVSQSRY